MCKRPVFAKISQPNFVTVAPQSFEGTLLIILVSKQVSNPSLDQHPRSVLKSFPIIEAPTSDWKKVQVGISLQQSFVGQAFNFANNFLGIIFTVIFCSKIEVEASHIMVEASQIEAEASHSMVEASHDMVEASQIAVEASHHPCW